MFRIWAYGRGVCGASSTTTSELGVKNSTYVTPVVVCEHVCWLVIEKCQIGSFDVHYSKTLNGITADLFVCILIDVVRCSTSWNFWNISEIFHEIFHEISRAKKSWNFTSLGDAKRFGIAGHTVWTGVGSNPVETRPTSTSVTTPNLDILGQAFGALSRISYEKKSHFLSHLSTSLEVIETDRERSATHVFCFSNYMGLPRTASEIKKTNFSDPVYSPPPCWVGFSWNFVTVWSIKKTRMMIYQTAKKCDDIFICLNIIPALDRQTDGQ